MHKITHLLLFCFCFSWANTLSGQEEHPWSGKIEKRLNQFVNWIIKEDKKYNDRLFYSSDIPFGNWFPNGNSEEDNYPGIKSYFYSSMKKDGRKNYWHEFKIEGAEFAVSDVFKKDDSCLSNFEFLDDILNSISLDQHLSITRIRYLEVQDNHFHNTEKGPKPSLQDGPYKKDLIILWINTSKKDKGFNKSKLKILGAWNGEGQQDVFDRMIKMDLKNSGDAKDRLVIAKNELSTAHSIALEFMNKYVVDLFATLQNDANGVWLKREYFWEQAHFEHREKRKVKSRIPILKWLNTRISENKSWEEISTSIYTDELRPKPKGESGKNGYYTFKLSVDWKHVSKESKDTIQESGLYKYIVSFDKYSKSGGFNSLKITEVAFYENELFSIRQKYKALPVEPTEGKVVDKYKLQKEALTKVINERGIPMVADYLSQFERIANGESLSISERDRLLSLFKDSGRKSTVHVTSKEKSDQFLIKSIPLSEYVKPSYWNNVDLTAKLDIKDSIRYGEIGKSRWVARIPFLQSYRSATYQDCTYKELFIEIRKEGDDFTVELLNVRTFPYKTFPIEECPD